MPRVILVPADRRAFLRNSSLGMIAAALAGCGATPSPSVVTSPPSPDAGGGPPPFDAANDAALDSLDATPGCFETEDNILGPYYRPGAPTRGTLADASLAGVRLTVRGRVYGAGCGLALAGATLDVWQADARGVYDLDGYVLRGKFVADANGDYELKTIVPGHYLNGAQYRPAHVHVHVVARGHKQLTTQLYLDGDPYNAIDPFIKSSLVMKAGDDGVGGRLARFDFVLAAV